MTAMGPMREQAYPTFPKHAAMAPLAPIHECCKCLGMAECQIGMAE